MEDVERAPLEMAPLVGDRLGSVCSKEWCRADGQPPHRCPYRSEIEGDDETLCMCCVVCEEECARDV